MLCCKRVFMPLAETTRLHFSGILFVVAAGLYSQAGRFFVFAAYSVREAGHDGTKADISAG